MYAASERKHAHHAEGWWQAALVFFFFSSRRRHTRFKCDWSSDVCSSDLDISEHRRGADERHGLGGRAEGEARADHRIARAYSLGHEHHQQRISAARACHRMAGTAEGRERRFELSHLGTENELTMVEHAGDPAIDAVTKPAALGGDVDERNRCGVEPGVLIHGAEHGPVMSNYSPRSWPGS